MTDTPPAFRKFDGFRWEATELLAYKDAGSAPFKTVTRQTLFRTQALGCELRYFEVAPGGYSTFERHEHMHAVMILRGAGECLVGDAVSPVATHDLVSIPAWHWHQFRAAADTPLGFLCMVNAVRDKPQLPTPAEWADLRSRPAVARFLGEAATGGD